MASELPRLTVATLGPEEWDHWPCRQVSPDVTMGRERSPMDTDTTTNTSLSTAPTTQTGLVVIALGDSALLRPGEPFDAAVHRANIKVAAEAIAGIAKDHRVVVIHGNALQLGPLTDHSEAAGDGDPLGSLLDEELGLHIPRERLASLVTQVVVDPDDPAFEHPTEFVGPGYDARDGRFIAHERGWTVAPDGARWRRVIPSPQPKGIVEINTIRILVDHDVVVTCNGGGGIPVAPDGAGRHQGVEAVIDSDLSASLLATLLDADALVLLTDVDAVYVGWGAPHQRAVRQTTPTELRSLELPADSMRPKAEAVCRFVEAGGRIGGIGPVDRATAIVRGEAGTIVRG